MAPKVPKQLEKGQTKLSSFFTQTQKDDVISIPGTSKTPPRKGAFWCNARVSKLKQVLEQTKKRPATAAHDDDGGDEEIEFMGVTPTQQQSAKRRRVILSDDSDEGETENVGPMETPKVARVSDTIMSVQNRVNFSSFPLRRSQLPLRFFPPHHQSHRHRRRRVQQRKRLQHQSAQKRFSQVIQRVHLPISIALTRLLLLYKKTFFLYGLFMFRKVQTRQTSSLRNRKSRNQAKRIRQAQRKRPQAASSKLLIMMMAA